MIVGLNEDSFKTPCGWLAWVNCWIIYLDWLKIGGAKNLRYFHHLLGSEV